MFKVNKKVSRDIIQNTNSIHVGEIQVSGCNYYVKPDDDKMELIGYALACLSSLPAILYRSIHVRNKNYSISRDMRQQYFFLLAEELMGNIRYIPEILGKLRKLDFYNEELEHQLYQMYFFDFLFLNNDRYPRNFGFYRDNSKWNLILFDHMRLFDVSYPLALRYNPNNFLETELLSAYYKDFLEFYYNMSDDVQEKIRKMYEIYNPLEVESIINKINPEKRNTFMNIYQNHYEKVGIILNRGVKYGR